MSHCFLLFWAGPKLKLASAPLVPPPSRTLRYYTCRQWLDILYPTPYCYTFALPSSSCHHLLDVAFRPSSQRNPQRNQQRRYEHRSNSTMSQPLAPPLLIQQQQQQTLVLIPTSLTNLDQSNRPYPPVSNRIYHKRHVSARPCPIHSWLVVNVSDQYYV